MVAREVERSETAAGGDNPSHEVAGQVKVLQPGAVGEVREAGGDLISGEAQPPDRPEVGTHHPAVQGGKPLPATASVLGCTNRITEQIQRFEAAAGAGECGHVGDGTAQHGISGEVEHLELAAAPAAGRRRERIADVGPAEAEPLDAAELQQGGRDSVDVDIEQDGGELERREALAPAHCAGEPAGAVARGPAVERHLVGQRRLEVV
uniref:Uncharacterized protein n=1 Tax=Triticum urartu TaxID=4572 RepID=A0A8R7V9G0_TRIUA